MPYSTCFPSLEVCSQCWKVSELQYQGYYPVLEGYHDDSMSKVTRLDKPSLNSFIQELTVFRDIIVVRKRAVIHNALEMSDSAIRVRL